MTTLLLYKSGFVVGKYISLEKKISDTKDDYYDALSESSLGRHDGSNDDTPFVKYLLSTVLAAYRDFEERVEIVDSEEDRQIREVRHHGIMPGPLDQLHRDCPTCVSEGRIH